MRALLYLAVAFAAGCAQPPAPAPDNHRWEGFVPPPRGAAVTVVPALPRGDHKEVAKGEAMLLDELQRQLSAAGYRVVPVADEKRDAFWRQEMAAVGGIYDRSTGAFRPSSYSRAMAGYARKVCEEAGCALLLNARLAVRTAKLTGREAEWDGQRRAVSIVTGQNAFGHRFTGSTRGISVELIAVKSDGFPAYRAFGGVTLIYEEDPKNTRSVLRADLFGQAMEIADGVRIVLEPLLAPR